MIIYERPSKYNTWNVTQQDLLSFKVQTQRLHTAPLITFYLGDEVYKNDVLKQKQNIINDFTLRNFMNGPFHTIHGM